jgi:hypothetical protein
MTHRLTFREAEVTRLIRAARKAGETVHRLEVAPDGTLKAFLHPTTESDVDAELDRELEEFRLRLASRPLESRPRAAGRTAQEHLRQRVQTRMEAEKQARPRKRRPSATPASET